MNPLMVIEPWELPPDCDAPRVAPADFVFRSLWQARTCDNAPENEKPFITRAYKKHYQTEVWARRVPYKEDFLFFMCDGKNPDDGNWHFSEFNLEIPKKDWNSRFLSQKLREAFFWYCNARRFVYFDATPYGFSGPHYLIMFPGVPFNYNVNRYDTAAGWDWEKITCFHTPFNIPDLLASFGTQKTQILSLFADKDSDAYFALCWLHATQEQQRAKVIYFQRGNLEEMQRLLRAALTIQTDLWEEHSSLYWETRDWWDAKSYRGPKEDHLSGRYTHPPTHVPEIPPQLNEWKKIIWDYFRPDLFMLAMSASASRTEIATISVEASRPTQHERLEALLDLRDWWQHTLTPHLFGNDSSLT